MLIKAILIMQNHQAEEAGQEPAPEMGTWEEIPVGEQKGTHPIVM